MEICIYDYEILLNNDYTIFIMQIIQGRKYEILRNTYVHHTLCICGMVYSKKHKLSFMEKTVCYL